MIEKIEAAASVAPAPESAGAPDLVGALLNIEEGCYAISALVRDPIEHGVEADESWAGVRYVIGKIRDDLRDLINPLSDAERRP